MNINRGFIVGCVVLFIIVFIVSYRVRSVNYTFSMGDIGYVNRSPMGIALFDELLDSSSTHGYEVVHKRFGELSQMDTTGQYNYFYVAYYGEFYPHEVEAIDSLLIRGSNVLLSLDVTRDFGYLAQYINIGLDRDMATWMSIEDVLLENSSSDDDLVWWTDSAHVAFSSTDIVTLKKIYVSSYVLPEYNLNLEVVEDEDTVEEEYSAEYDDGSVVVTDEDEYVENVGYEVRYRTFDESDAADFDDDETPLYMIPLTTRVLTPIVEKYSDRTDSDIPGNKCVAVRIDAPHWRGSLYVTGTPGLFTNLAVTASPEARQMAFRMMSLLNDKPIKRIALESVDVEESWSPMRDLMSRRPLKWAYYLTIAACILAMVFTARRRQRVIPVITPPVNHTIEMTRHFGDLYYRRRDNVDLVMKRYEMFITMLRRELMLDPETDDYNMCVREISAATGMARQDVADLLADIARVSEADFIGDRLMMQLIDGMERITRLID